MQVYEVLMAAIEFLQKKDISARHSLVEVTLSPFRTSIHLNEALRVYSSDIIRYSSVKETKSNPYYVLLKKISKGFLSKSKKTEFFCQKTRLS
jgi:N-acylneuraminate cytidylyltransferase